MSATLLCGVPQGSILGHILLFLYMNILYTTFWPLAQLLQYYLLSLLWQKHAARIFTILHACLACFTDWISKILTQTKKRPLWLTMTALLKGLLIMLGTSKPSKNCGVLSDQHLNLEHHISKVFSLISCIFIQIWVWKLILPNTFTTFCFLEAFSDLLS